MEKMREHSGSLFKERTVVEPATTYSAESQADAGEQRPFLTANSLSLDEPGRTPPQFPEQSILSSPDEAYPSTTEDDERTPIYQASASSSVSSFSLPVKDSNISLLRRRSHHAEGRPLLVETQSFVEVDPEDEWDYSETEWWGWIILVVTWVVFVVVMGSCFGVWSWAWDVGETPYAPPELEDDDTLPITGYYPALIVCTAVMSWVWVVIAWVGMKYFRHAKVV